MGFFVRTKSASKVKHPLGKARIAYKITQVNMAKAVGVDRVTLWRWEIGGAVPDEAWLKEWKAALRKLGGRVPHKKKGKGHGTARAAA